MRGPMSRIAEEEPKPFPYEEHICRSIQDLDIPEILWTIPPGEILCRTDWHYITGSPFEQHHISGDSRATTVEDWSAKWAMARDKQEDACLAGQFVGCMEAHQRTGSPRRTAGPVGNCVRDLCRSHVYGQPPAGEAKSLSQAHPGRRLG